MTKLKLSKDRKVSPLNRLRWVRARQRNQWDSLISNSFGLPAGDSCPGKTEFCRSCYGKSAEQRGSVANLLRHNYDLLVDATYEQMIFLLDEMLEAYEKEWKRKMGDAPMVFRIHWDGDFFSQNYYMAWMHVIFNRPHISFWCYTRSFNFISTSSRLPNLALYLSIDAENVDRGREVLSEYPWLRAAYCADVYRRADELAGKTVLQCPENNRRKPLVGDDGRGACISCAVCITGKTDISFASTHRQDVPVQIHRKQGSLF